MACASKRHECLPSGSVPTRRVSQQVSLVPLCSSPSTSLGPDPSSPFRACTVMRPDPTAARLRFVPPKTPERHRIVPRTAQPARPTRQCLGFLWPGWGPEAGGANYWLSPLECTARMGGAWSVEQGASCRYREDVIKPNKENDLYEYELHFVTSMSESNWQPRHKSRRLYLWHCQGCMSERVRSWERKREPCERGQGQMGMRAWKLSTSVQRNACGIFLLPAQKSRWKTGAKPKSCYSLPSVTQVKPDSRLNPLAPFILWNTRPAMAHGTDRLRPKSSVQHDPLHVSHQVRISCVPSGIWLPLAR